MRLLLSLMVVGVLVTEIVCPPVNPQPVEGNSEDEDALDDDSDSWEDDGEEWWDDFAEDAEEGFGLEYDRYLKEVVMALEEDSTFREKLEQMNMSDIKSGKIAMHLDLVSHHIRERLDEIKRQEIQRLRELARQKIKAMNGTQVMQSMQLYGGVQKMDQHYPHHVDVKNPHSFEMKDLENLIKKATSDLDEIDKKRKGEFKDYEMRKEHERQDELKDMDGEHRKAEEERYEEMQKKHQDHPKVHHPGSKDQLEDVWEKTDHMDPDDFDPKTFFKMHDMDGNGLLDQEEVEALFQKELDRVYDPNMPEDDMRERYEEMSRMREHVFNELDMDKDKMISVEEFMKYTTSQEFEKDEGWKGLDEQDVYSDDEFQKYEQMLREREEALQRQGLDPSMMQPGVVPLPHNPNDPNVQQMQMPQEGMPQHQQNLNQQQQQQLHQQQQQLHLQQQQQAMHQQIQQEIQQGLPLGGIPQGMPPGGVPQGMPPGGPSQGVKLPPQVPSGQPVNVQMPQGQVPVNAQHPQGGAGQNAQFQPVGVVPVQQGQQGEPLKYEGQHQQQEERQPMV